MTLDGDTISLYADVAKAAEEVRLDIEQSMDGLKKAYAMRTASPLHSKAWEKTSRGFNAACEVHRKLHELARQLRVLNGRAMLSEAECALMSYVQDKNLKQTPKFEPNAEHA